MAKHFTVTFTVSGEEGLGIDTTAEDARLYLAERYDGYPIAAGYCIDAGSFTVSETETTSTTEAATAQA